MILEPDYYKLSVEMGFSPLNHDLGTEWEPWNLIEDGERPYWVDGEGMEGPVEVIAEEETDE